MCIFSLVKSVYIYIYIDIYKPMTKHIKMNGIYLILLIIKEGNFSGTFHINYIRKYFKNAFEIIIEFIT